MRHLPFGIAGDRQRALIPVKIPSSQCEPAVPPPPSCKWMETGMFVVVDGKDQKGNTRKFVEVGEWASD
jgi:hypothetical protein